MARPSRWQQRRIPARAYAAYLTEVAVQKGPSIANQRASYWLIRSCCGPRYVDAYFRLGVWQEYFGTPAEALVQFQHVVRLDPSRVDARTAH